MNVRLFLELAFTAAIIGAAAYLHVYEAWQNLRKLRTWLTAAT
jgi:hypothetical protein